MRLFLDSNVWVAAFCTRGICADLVRTAIRLHGREDLVLLTSATVQRETLRILSDKIGLEDADIERAAIVMARMTQVPDRPWDAPRQFPDPDDLVIVGAALAAQADVLVTGDKALLGLGAIENLSVLSPRDAYQRLLDFD